MKEKEMVKKEVGMVGSHSKDLLAFVDELGEKAIVGDGLNISKLIVNYIQKNYSDGIAKLLSQGYSPEDIASIISEFEKVKRKTDKVNIAVEHINKIAEMLKVSVIIKEKKAPSNPTKIAINKKPRGRKKGVSKQPPQQSVENNTQASQEVMAN